MGWHSVPRYRNTSHAHTAPFFGHESIQTDAAEPFDYALRAHQTDERVYVLLLPTVRPPSSLCPYLSCTAGATLSHPVEEARTQHVTAPEPSPRGVRISGRRCASRSVRSANTRISQVLRLRAHFLRSCPQCPPPPAYHPPALFATSALRRRDGYDSSLAARVPGVPDTLDLYVHFGVIARRCGRARRGRITDAPHTREPCDRVFAACAGGLPFRLHQSNRGTQLRVPAPRFWMNPS
ncbi:hypothetical protein B0H14DRAFT_1633339 [Mycena olivaceomarginata]|nr:hypothetical protein B0H14DRAFT_1633339 [Mycena olivaceomarginata]